MVPTGENIKDDEFCALGEMLATMKWELPQVEEYKGDLVMPSFLSQGVISQASIAIGAPSHKPDPEGPCNVDQWAKVQKMVA